MTCGCEAKFGMRGDWLASPLVVGSMEISRDISIAAYSGATRGVSTDGGAVWRGLNRD